MGSIYAKSVKRWSHWNFVSYYIKVWIPKTKPNDEGTITTPTKKDEELHTTSNSQDSSK